ncbi:MAG: hypothetical protein Q8K45_05800 [Rubrivivax sp.]|nr:hypothetical protein [Rubrivivax sp.]
MKKTLHSPVRTLALALTLGTLSLGTTAPALAQVSVGIGIGVDLPGMHIGINVPMFPNLVRVPNSPAYYAPQLSANYFFYEDRYWVYEDDRWYTSTWYNGPWGYVQPEVVPLFVLRIPVRYYRQPPTYFRGWQRDAAPRWGEHWGPSWQNQRRGWDQWDRRRAPAPVALPTYQREYRGDRYPGAQQQQEWQRRDDRGPASARPPQRAPAYERPNIEAPRARPQPPERARQPEREQRPAERAAPPQREPNRGHDRGNDRGNERDKERGNDRGNDRKPDRDRKD